MGGFTCIPCALATVIAGLGAEIVYKVNTDKLIGFWWAILLAALIECFHMVLVLIILRPFPEALAIVEKVIFSMVLANLVGMAIAHLFIPRRI